MLFSQAGMFAVSKLGSAYRPVTVKSCILILIVSAVSLFLVCVYWELFGSKGKGAAALTVLFALIVIESFVHPLNGSYYRYSSLAAILVVELPLTVVMLGRHERKKISLDIKNMKVETAFAAVALISGILVVIFTPFGSYNCWDDEAHYRETVTYTQSIYPSFSEADIRLMYDKEQPLNFEVRKAYAAELQTYEDEGNALILEDARGILPARIGLLGCAAGLWAGRLLQLDFYSSYMMGRIANLLLYIALMFIAIKTIRKGKVLLLVLSLTPTMMFMAGNYSYDPWVFGFFSISFACFFNELEDTENRLSVRNAVIMIGTMLLAVLPKLPYLCLFPLLLLIPKEKFESIRDRRAFVFAVLITMAVAFAYLYLTSFAMGGDPADDRTGRGEVSSIRQIAFILSNPAGYISLLISFLKDYLNPENAYSFLTAYGLMGVGYGKLAFLVLLAAAAVNCAPKTNIPRRALGVIAFFAMCAILATLFYMVFTPVGADYILGCQPRYVYPMLFMFISFLLGGWVRPDNRYVNSLLVAGTSATLLYSLVSFLVVPYFGG